MRHVWLAAAVAAGLAATGCCTCDAPYDDCYPTFTGSDCGEPCCRTHERVGSIHYSGMLPDSATWYETSEQVPTPTVAEPIPADNE